MLVNMDKNVGREEKLDEEDMGQELLIEPNIDPIKPKVNVLVNMNR